MKRYFLSPVIGSGTESDPYRAKLAERGVAHSAVIPTAEDGQPLFPWCLAVVSGADLSALIADTDLDGLPNLAKDTTILASQRPALRQMLQRRGLPTALADAPTMRALMRGIGRTLDPTFHEDNLDVAE